MAVVTIGNYYAEWQPSGNMENAGCGRIILRSAVVSGASLNAVKSPKSIPSSLTRMAIGMNVFPTSWTSPPAKASCGSRPLMPAGPCSCISLAIT